MTGAAEPRGPRPIPRCGRAGCQKEGGFGFGPPYRMADRGTLHACADHREAARARWRQIYGLEDER